MQLAASPQEGAMEDLGHIIADHPFGNGLNARYVDLLVSCAANVRFDADQHLFREGGEQTSFIWFGKARWHLRFLRPYVPLSS